MNDRYLFRGKRVDGKGWVIGYYAFQPKRRGAFGQTMTEHDSDRYLISLRRNGEVYEINPTTIGQCTELKDKNGELIFEGDIIRITCNGHPDNGTVGRVKFGEYTHFAENANYLGFHIEWEGKGAYALQKHILYWLDNGNIEVIGKSAGTGDSGR